MKVLLTGATGYVGSVIVERLQAHGHEVVALVRSRAVSDSLKNRGLEVCMGDLLDLSGLAAAASRADGVIHAGFAGMADFTAALEHDRLVALTFIDALTGSGKPFIYSSGGMIVVDRSVGEPSDRLVREDDPLTMTPAFIQPRANAERDVLAAAEKGVRSIVLRLASVYGRGGSHFIPMLIRAIRQGGGGAYVGRGLNRWPHVHVEDAAEAYVLAFERAPAGSLFNVASEDWDMKTVTEAVAVAAGFPGRTKSWTLEEAQQVWGPFAAPLAANGRLASEKIRKELGWTPKGPSVMEELTFGSYSQLASSLSAASA